MLKVSDLELPGLDPVLQASLAAQVPTVKDFLVRRPRLHFQDDPDGLQEQQANEALLQQVREHIAPPVRSGAAILAGLRNARLLPIGCTCLDQLLRGGLREGHHTEVAGEPGSGKSQLCMRVAANTALRGERVVYIDAGGTFQPRRFGEMHERLARRASGATGEWDPGGPDRMASFVNVLGCVELFVLHDLPSLLQALAALHARLQAEEQQRQQAPEGAQQPRVTLVIVDSVSFVASATMAPSATRADGAGGQAGLVALGRALKALAQRFSLVVLTTCHLVGDINDARPALGEVWKAQANAQLVLACLGGPVRRATLAASSLTPCGASAWFQLAGGGLEACGPGS